MVRVTFPRRHSHARREVPNANGPEAEPAVDGCCLFVKEKTGPPGSRDWLVGWYRKVAPHTHLQDFGWVHSLMPGCITNRNRSQISCDEETFAWWWNPVWRHLSLLVRHRFLHLSGDLWARERWCGASSLPVVALWSPSSSTCWRL